jgi:ELWxxDGT repeat protein
MIPSHHPIRHAPLPTLLALLVLLAGTLGLPAANTLAATISTIIQVKDINLRGANAYPVNLTNVNGTLFFTADDGSSGAELWRSDGSAAGTVLVRDINPGSFSSNPANLANVNGTLFLVADNGSSGAELWKQVSLTVEGYLPLVTH